MTLRIQVHKLFYHDITSGYIGWGVRKKIGSKNFKKYQYLLILLRDQKLMQVPRVDTIVQLDIIEIISMFLKSIYQLNRVI